MRSVTSVLQQRLGKLMEIRNINGRELAEKADMHTVTISKILNNKMPQVSLNIVYRLAVALGMTIGDLMDERELYAEHDQKIMQLRDQFEKYGYESVDAIIELIPSLSRKLQEARHSGKSSEAKLQEQHAGLQKRYGTQKKKIA